MKHYMQKIIVKNISRKINGLNHFDWKWNEFESKIHMQLRHGILKVNLTSSCEEKLNWVNSNVELHLTNLS